MIGSKISIERNRSRPPAPNVVLDRRAGGSVDWLGGSGGALTVDIVPPRPPRLPRKASVSITQYWQISDLAALICQYWVHEHLSERHATLRTSL
jgi:hypothetical protein